jgi:hypothetical protein
MRFEPVTTTDGSRFSVEQSRAMARLVYARFSYDWEAAADAWRRLLGINCTDYAFQTLAQDPGKPFDKGERLRVSYPSSDAERVCYKEIVLFGWLDDHGYAVCLRLDAALGAAAQVRLDPDALERV